jgi:DNA-binding NarL/FixJ family response regulator
VHERILIVEEEIITAMEIRHHIQNLGYEPPGPCASGQEAVTNASTLHPDAILMDIIVKGPMDGIRAAQAIPSQQQCPVIYVTAHSDQSTLDRAKVTEPFGYILKSINQRELHAAIEIAPCRHSNSEGAGSRSGNHPQERRRGHHRSQYPRGGNVRLRAFSAGPRRMQLGKARLRCST